MFRQIVLRWTEQTTLFRVIASVGLVFLGGCFGNLAHSEVVADTVVAAGGACTLPSKITKNLQLDPDCSYQGSTIITASNVTLDCRGAQINAGDAKTPLIQIRGRGLQDITVKNCRIVNSLANGVRVTSDLNAKALNDLPDLKDRYAAAPSNIVLENLTVSNAAASGIFINDYVTKTTVRGTMVEGSGSVGIYLEQSSADNTVENSILRKNGFGTKETPRRGVARREGLAVDSSARNVIRSNRFEHNAAGGIFLYKNCGEKNGLHRWQSAEKNIISDNTFSGEEIGVWVASRQSRNLSNWECSDQAYAPGFYQDSAKDNILSGNKFNGVLSGIKIEDDGTQVLNNKMESFVCLTVGSKPRHQYLKQPIIETVVIGNRCMAEMPSAGYVFTDEAKPKEFQNNLLDSRPASPIFQ